MEHTLKSRFVKKINCIKTNSRLQSTITKANFKMASNGSTVEAELTEPQSSSYKKPTSPSGVPLSQISPKFFPLSIRESFTHYWGKKDLLKIQDELLSTLPFYPEPSKTHSSKVINFQSSNSLIFPDINEFHVKPTINNDNGKHLVIIHGYGAGLGFFIKNIEEISAKHPNWHIHAIDLPGYGCSTRVDFPHQIPNEQHEVVEKLFTIPLRDWFVSRGLNEDNTITIAHSMGGYFSLLLQMNEIENKNVITNDEFKFLQKKFNFFNSKFKKQKDIFDKQSLELSNTSLNPYKFWETLILVSPGGIYHSRADEIEKRVPIWFTRLWNMNVSPFSLIRGSGPLGSYFVSAWTSRRFAISKLFDDNLYQLLHQYSYAIFDAKGSGEYMLNYILGPGGYPRHPLFDRIKTFQNLPGKTIWMYGDHDWMDKTGGILSSDVITKNGGNASVEIIENAGHHIYLDAFDTFNSRVGDEMERFEKKKTT